MPKTKTSSPQERFPQVVIMRGSQDWKEWLGILADTVGSDLSGTIDRALRELAKRNGVEPPPPRIPRKTP